MRSEREHMHSSKLHNWIKTFILEVTIWEIRHTNWPGICCLYRDRVYISDQVLFRAIWWAADELSYKNVLLQLFQILYTLKDCYISNIAQVVLLNWDYSPQVILDPNKICVIFNVSPCTVYSMTLDFLIEVLSRFVPWLIFTFLHNATERHFNHCGSPGLGKFTGKYVIVFGTNSN